MKMIKTNNQIEFKDNGWLSLVVAIILTIAGIALLAVAITDGMNLVMLGIGAILLLIGAAIALLAKKKVVTVVKDGEVSVYQKRLLFGKPVTQSVPVSRVKAVRLQTSTETRSNSNDKSDRPSRTSRLTLVLDDNTLVEVARKSQNNSSVNEINLNAFKKAPLSKEGQALAEFLGLELDAADTSTLKGAVDMFKNAFGANTADTNPAQTINNLQANETTPVATVPSVDQAGNTSSVASFATTAAVAGAAAPKMNEQPSTDVPGIPVVEPSTESTTSSAAGLPTEQPVAAPVPISANLEPTAQPDSLIQPTSPQSQGGIATAPSAPVQPDRVAVPTATRSNYPSPEIPDRQ